MNNFTKIFFSLCPLVFGLISAPYEVHGVTDGALHRVHSLCSFVLLKVHRFRKYRLTAGDDAQPSPFGERLLCQP